MDPRLPLLTLPSAVALALLVAHSWRALDRRRALLFWSTCVLYGVLRGAAVRAITERAFGGAMPYAIREPLLTVAGVSLQEVAGWAIVAYLGWWIGHRLADDCVDTPRLAPQIAWAVLWLAAIAWAVEATAIAAGWWSWRIPVAGGLPGGVPPIGLVDWAFVGIDFLVPFVALTAPSLRTARWRFATLLLFPLHFGGHLVVERVVPGVPVPGLHIVHWALALGLLWAAARHAARDRAFPARAGDGTAVAGAAIVLGDLAFVQLAVIGRPALLVTLVPATLLVALAWRRPAFLAGPWARVARLGRSPVAAALLIALLGAAGLAVHRRSAGVERETLAALDRALAARDAGRLDEAVAGLRAINEPHPRSHAAAGLEGEIHYRRGRLSDARAAFETALSIKDDDARARRHLAVIALREGRPADALALATRGAELDADDLQLRYLRDRAATPGQVAIDVALPPSAAEAAALAALAFEVDDRSTAERVLDAAIERWPTERALRDRRLRVALAAGDTAAARRVVVRWLAAFPADAIALEHARRLGLDESF